MHIFTRLLTFFVFFEAVFTAIVITTPNMGVKFTANGNEVVIPVTWQDDGTDPKDDQISSYVFTLCTGPNTAIHALQKIEQIQSSDMSVPAYNAIFDSNLATDGLFYIQVYCQLSNGGYLIRYTNRFQLAGMTGSYQASGSGVAPDGETHDQQDAEAAAQKISASFSVPYTEQTGSTRYAPMQLQPDSTITVTAWSRRFPSSSVTYYSTFHPSPNVLSTITPGWSYTMTSAFNYATPAPFPSEVSWYPASARLVSASLDPNLGNSKRKLKKRRWVD